MKIRIALAALAGAATLAAIGVTATATAASASTFPGPGPGPRGPTPVASVTYRVPACTVSQLSATLSGGYGYQWSQYSQRELTLTLTNHGWQACTVSGYPGLQLLGIRYQSLPTTVVPVSSWGSSTVTLYPGQSATDTISYAVAGPYYPAPVHTGLPYYAPSAYYLRVTLPSSYPTYPTTYPTYPTYPTTYSTYPMYGWQSSFTLKIPGAPVRIAQDKLSETALTGSHFVW